MATTSSSAWNPKAYPLQGPAVTLGQDSAASSSGSSGSRSSSKPRDLSAAITEFKSIFGRDPTADELARAGGMSEAAIRSYLSTAKTNAGNASAAASGSAASSGDSSNMQTGYGGQSTWDAIKQYGIRDENTLKGIDFSDPKELEALTRNFENSLSGMSESEKKLQTYADELMSGKVPADVAQALEQRASESSISGGIFGQASRALTARDLGQTSLQLKQQGADAQAKIAALQESRGRLSEIKRQFDKQLDLNSAQLQMTQRELNLKGVELEQNRLQFNAKSNLLLLQLITDTVKSQYELGAELASNDMDPSGVMDTFGSLLGELRSRLV